MVFYALTEVFNSSRGTGQMLMHPKIMFDRYYCIKKFCDTRKLNNLLLWFLTVTCSCCPYLYFGSAIMLVTYFVNFR